VAKGLADTLADPKAAYDISRKYVENLKADDPVQYAVLTNSLELWKTDHLGYSDPAAWKLTLDTLQAMGLSKVFSNGYLPAPSAVPGGIPTAQATDAAG